MNRALLCSVFLLCGVAGFFIMRDRGRGVYDFQAFYCAGEALREHADPYRTQPLGACEHRETDGSYAALPPSVVLPAPQPPFDIAGFAVLSLLPFALAKELWGGILGVSVALVIVSAFRFTRSSVATIFVSFAASLVLPAFGFGEIVAIYAAACCACAFLVQRGSLPLAGLAAACTMTEPHLGLPVCVSLAVWGPGARLALGTGTALLVATSLICAGWSVSVEYVATVLPLHAISELTSGAQLSLASLMQAIGASDTLALRVGLISYLGLSGVAIWLGRILARHFDDDAFIVVVPAAFATMGGTFIHVTELFAAIPLALVLLRYAKENCATVVGGLLLLAVPWQTAMEGGGERPFALLGAAVVAFLLWELTEGSLVALIATAVTFAAISVVPLLSHDVPALHLPRVSTYLDPAYPQAGWQMWVERAIPNDSAVGWFLRGLSWTGLFLLGFATIALTQQKLSKSRIDD